MQEFPAPLSPAISFFQPIHRCLGRGSKIGSSLAGPEQVRSGRLTPTAKARRVTNSSCQHLLLLVPVAAARHQSRTPVNGIRSSLPSPLVPLKYSESVASRGRKVQALRQPILRGGLQGPSHPRTSFEATAAEDVTEPFKKHVHAVNPELELAHLPKGVTTTEKLALLVMPPVQLLENLHGHREEVKPLLSQEPKGGMLHPSSLLGSIANRLPKSAPLHRQFWVASPTSHLKSQHQGSISCQVLVKQVSKGTDNLLQVILRDGRKSTRPSKLRHHQAAKHPPLFNQASNSHPNQSHPANNLFQDKVLDRGDRALLEVDMQVQDGQRVAHTVLQLRRESRRLGGR